MAKEITREEFDALRPMNSDLVLTERDGEFTYEIIVDYDGAEVAFASYHSHREPVYTLRSE